MALVGRLTKVSVRLCDMDSKFFFLKESRARTYSIKILSRVSDQSRLIVETAAACVHKRVAYSRLLRLCFLASIRRRCVGACARVRPRPAENTQRMCIMRDKKSS